MAAVGKVSVLYDAKALHGEGPFYDESTDELLWVDIPGKSINFLNVNTRTNRSIQLETCPGAAIPCGDDNSKVVVVTGKNICLMDRETGMLFIYYYSGFTALKSAEGIPELNTGSRRKRRQI